MFLHIPDENQWVIFSSMSLMGDNGAMAVHLIGSWSCFATAIAGVGCNKHLGAGCNVTTNPTYLG